MALFWGVTVAGFGLSIHELANPGRLNGTSGVKFVETNPQTPELHSRFEWIDLGCIERRGLQNRMLSSEPQVKLKARFCGLPKSTMAELHEIRLRNLSTGYETWLPIESNSFLSENLNLQKGRNVIQLEWSEKGSGGNRMVRAEVFGK